MSGQKGPAALPLGKTDSIHRMGGWVGPRVGLEVLEKGKKNSGSSVSNKKLWKEAVGAEFGLPKGAEDNHVNLIWIMCNPVEIGLEVNADKTKHMIMSRNQNALRSYSMKTDKVPLKGWKSSNILEQR